MPETVIVAIIALIGTLTGTYFGQRKSTALIMYRIERLEKTVEKHNGVVGRTAILEEQMKVANRRIKNLEGRE